jgi:predicted Ser/Thr protein kinase
LIPVLSDSVGLDRRNLAKHTRAVLNRGGWGNPDVLLVETEAGSVVVKDFSPRTCFVRRLLGPWLLRREARAYQCLEGVEAVPRFLGQIDAAALVFEYRPGVLLSRSLAGRLPANFLVDLQGTIAEMHRRGVVHLDLRHRSNILAGRDGRPVLLDFASALRFDRSTWWGRVGVVALGWVDRRALRKWQLRLT